MHFCNSSTVIFLLELYLEVLMVIDAVQYQSDNLIDGFHLIIKALQLNDIENIYNVPGIPITDLGRMMAAPAG